MKKKTVILIGAGVTVVWLIYQSQKKAADEVATVVTLQQQALKDAMAAAQGTVHGGVGVDLLQPHPGRTVYAGGQQVLGDLLRPHPGRTVYEGGQQVLGDPLMVDDMCEPSYSRATINYFQPIEGLDGFGKAFKRVTRGIAKHSIVGKVIQKIAPKPLKKVLAKIDPTRPKPAPAPAAGEVIEYQDENGNVISEAEYNRRVAAAQAQAANDAENARIASEQRETADRLAQGRIIKTAPTTVVQAQQNTQAPSLPPPPPATQFTASSTGSPGLPESISQLQLPSGPAVQQAPPAEAPKTNIAPLVGVGAAAALLMAFS